MVTTRKLPSRLHHTAYTTKDMEKTRAFYEEVHRVLMHKVFPRQALVVQSQDWLQVLAPLAAKP